MDLPTSELVFYVNGKKIVERQPDPEATLLQYLRRTIQIPGTKQGCSHGACGACTVMVSKYDVTTGRISHYTVNACIFPLCAAHGLAITTVEGIGSRQTGLHDVQKRLVESHGLQCGFCSPGVVMTMFTLVRNNPTPSKDDIEKALEGNLCRCTGYRPILEAYRTLAQDACPLGKECCQNNPNDSSGSSGESTPEREPVTEEVGEDDMDVSTQVAIFPAELQLVPDYSTKEVVFHGKKWTWIRPTTVHELLALKDKNRQAPVIMGHTTTAFQMKDGEYDSSYVLLYGACVPALKEVKVTETGISFGAALTITEFKRSLEELTSLLDASAQRYFPALLDMVNAYGADQIRNVATLGGSIMSGLSNSDVITILSAVDARISVASAHGERELHMHEKPKDEEVILAVHVPFSTAEDHLMFCKHAERRTFSMAMVNAGFCAKLDAQRKIKHLRLCFGGLRDRVIQLTTERTFSRVLGRTWDDPLLRSVLQYISDCMVADQDSIEKFPALDEESRRLVLDSLSETMATDQDTAAETHKLAVASAFFLRFYNHCLQSLGVNIDKANNVDPVAQVPADGVVVYTKSEKNENDNGGVGEPIPNVASEAITTGGALFVDDRPGVKGELALALVTSTRAHAKILSVDTTEALALPGVHCYIDHTDIPGVNNWGSIIKDEEVFASTEVQCYGQTIGAVVADTRELAEQAAKLVEVHYENLKAIMTIPEAINESSFHPKSTSVTYGNLKIGFSMADVKLTGEYYSGLQEHFYMEPHAALVVPKMEDGEIEIFPTSHNLLCTQESVSRMLNIPRHKVICRVKRLGGSFGGKDTRNVLLTGPTAIAAFKLKKPVRCVLGREKDMEISGKRDPFYGKYKIGCTREGKITALDLSLYADGGFSQDSSGEVMKIGAMMFEQGQKFPNVQVDGLVCKTNTPSNTSFRGFGAPQAALVMEDAIFNVACALEKTQEQIREINLYREGDVTHYLMPMTSCSVEVLWHMCKEKSNYLKRELSVRKFNRKHRWKKRGIAMTTEKFGVGLPPIMLNQASALVHVYLDGSVLIAHGGVEMGQGLNTKLTQIASRELGVEMGRVTISETSTRTVPNSIYLGGSFVTEMFGPAVVDACDKIKERLQPYMYENPNATWEDLVSEAFLHRVSLSATGYTRMKREEEFDLEKKTGYPYDYFTYGAICTEVEIDSLTGENQVLQVDILIDVGKSLNPAIDIGQIEGGFVQGLGMVTSEETVIAADGRTTNCSPLTYKIPTCRDIPRRFNVSLIDHYGVEVPACSSKSTGEPPLLLSLSVIMAIKEAVKAARAEVGLHGYFRLDSPATVAKIQAACGDQLSKV